MTYAKLLSLALAWACLAIAPGMSEPIKLAGMTLVAGGLALQLPAPVLPRLARGVLLAYAFSFGLSTGFALEPQVALFGTLARAQGLLAVLGLVTLAGAAAHCSEQARERLYQSAALLAALVGAYAVMQVLDLDPWHWAGAVPGRPAATLSNASVLGGFLMLALPLTAWLAVRASAAVALEPGKGRRLPWFWCCMLALQLAGLVASATRSALLALALVVVVIGWARPALSRWRLPVAVGVLALVAALGTQRIESLQDRAMLWASAVRAVSAEQALVDVHGQGDALHEWRPWLGYGPDLQQAPLRAARAPASAVRAHAAGWQADRAHQGLLDRLLETGLLGLGASLALAGVVALRLRRWFASTTDRHEAVAVGAALGAWVLHLQLGFALTGDRTLAWILIGFALAAGAPRLAPARLETSSHARWPLLLAPLLLAGAAISSGLFPDATAALSAERAFMAGQQRYGQALAGAPEGAAPALDAAARAFERAAALRPYDTDAALAAASAWIENAQVSGDSEAIARAQRWCDAVRAMDPRDPRLQAVDARIDQVRNAMPVEPRDVSSGTRAG